MASADTVTDAESAGSTPNLARLRRMFDEARSLTQEARNEAMIDVDYYDSKQWTAAERAALRKRKQPDIVINRIKPAVNGILGVTARGHTDPRAFPRTPDDEDSADVATDVLRYVADKNQFNHLKIRCFKDMLVPGTMAAIVEVDDVLDVKVTQVRWEEFFYDPRSRRENFADARYLGIAKWMYGDDVDALYPDKHDEIAAALDGSSPVTTDETYRDRPLNGQLPWVDRRARRLMLVELYHRENGVWQKTCFVFGAVLESGPSPYKDHKDKPCCPIEAQSAYVDRDNNRYGAVRDMRGPQDEINKRRSKLLHLLSVSQIEVGDPSAIDVDADVARAEAAKPDGVIPFGWRKVPTNDMAAGQAQLLAEAKSEIERFAPNPALLGRDDADASGRALLARQQAGLVELATLFAHVEDWELRVYKQVWERVRQYWRAPMFVRVTDDEDSPKFIGINQPVHQMQPVMDPNNPGQPMMDAQGQPKQAPTMYAHPQEDGTTKIGPHVLGYENQVGEMDVDIILESQSDTANIQAEQFQDLTQLVGSNPAYAQTVPFEVMLELSAVPHKRALIAKLKAASAQRQQEQAQTQQQMQTVQLALQAANIRKTSAQADESEAKAQKISSGAVIDAHSQGLTDGASTVPAFQPPQPPQPAAGGPAMDTGAPAFSAAS